MTSPATIILIGMPAAGKSTVGKLLARHLGWRFIDTDTLIIDKAGRSLQHILEENDYLHLRTLEEQAILSSDFDHAVVATGGSAVYSQAAIDHLASYGPLVFLDISLETLMQRLNNFGSRGIASEPGQDLKAIYRDRLPRYRAAADLTVDVDSLNEQQVVEKIVELLQCKPAAGQA